MYIGLTLTYASSFQMFRGSIILFVAIFSMTFLNRQIIAREWTGIGKFLYPSIWHYFYYIHPLLIFKCVYILKIFFLTINKSVSYLCNKSG